MTLSSLRHRLPDDGAALPALGDSRRGWPGRIRGSSVLIALTVCLSGVGAFSATRARLAPRAIAEPYAAAATLTVETEPAGAEIFVDQDRRGTAPLTLSVKPGPHTMTVRRGTVERRVVFTAQPGEQLTNLIDIGSLEVQADSGRLSVVTDPAGARVTVDGQPRGVSPLTVDQLATGTHDVVVATSGGTAERTVAVERGVTNEVVFSISRPTGAALGGWIAVAAPFPVDLLESGELVGTSGAAKVMVPAGSHHLVVRNESVGFEAARTVDVAAGKVTALRIVPPNGVLDVNARPWAEVLIDGTSVGETPLAHLEVPLGSHEITFRHPDLGVRHLTVLVTVDGPNRAAVDLTR